MPETGLLSLLAQATLVVKFVLALLAGMSLVSWSIIFFKIFILTSARRQVEAETAAFQEADDLRTAIGHIGRGAQSACLGVAKAGVAELNALKNIDPFDPRMGDGTQLIRDNVRRALDQGVRSQVRVLNRALSFLATCANAAPFIGLFGTVWGIMHSFHAIGAMKTASLAAVAPGISEALVATAIGLGVAIPATIAYNFFLSKITQIEGELTSFAGVFLNRVQRELPLILAQKARGDEFKEF